MFLKTNMLLVSFIFTGCIVHASVAITLKIAWLAPNNSVRTTVNSETSVGALKLALNMIEKNNILKGHSISIKYFPVTCEVNSVVGTMLSLRRTFKPDVVIGPPCQSGFETIGLLAADWNIPLLSWHNTGSELDDATRYPTTLRLIPSVSFLGRVLINLVKQLQQNKVIVLHYQSNPWEATKQSVAKEARQASLSTIPVPVERGLSNNEMRQLISSVKGVPILALICPADLVRQIMLIAADLGMTDGNYVFIWLDPEMHVGSVLSDSGWKKGDNLDTKAKTAYKHLIRVVYNPMYDAASPTVSTPTNKFDVFSRLVATRSQTNNPAWKLPVAGKPDIYSMYLYDAILFWSAVTSKLLKSNSKYRDGRIVATEAKSFEARGASGFISLNKNLDRHGKVFVLKMAHTGIFKPVQIFRSSDKGTDHILLEPLGHTNIVSGKNSLQTSKTKDTLATGNHTAHKTTMTSPIHPVTTQNSPATQLRTAATGKPTDKVTVSSLKALVNKSDKNASIDMQKNVSGKEFNKIKAGIIEKDPATQLNSPKTVEAEIVEKEVPAQVTPTAKPAELVEKEVPAQVTPTTKPAELVEKEVPAQVTPTTKPAELVEKEVPAQVKPTTKPAELVEKEVPAQVTPTTKPAEIVEKEVPAQVTPTTKPAELVEKQGTVQQTAPVLANSTKLHLENKTVAAKYNSSTIKQLSTTTVKPTTTQNPTETTSQAGKTTTTTLTQRQRYIWRQVMGEHYQSMINTMREELGLPELMVPAAMLDKFIAQNRHLFDPTTTVPITSSVAPKPTKTVLNKGQPGKTFIIVNSNDLQRTMRTRNNYNTLVLYLSKLIRNMSRNSLLAPRIPLTTTTEYIPTEEPWWMA